MDVQERVSDGGSVATDPAPQGVKQDRPTVAPRRPERPEWGSDIAAEMLRRLNVQYIALNPGASFRGLHDSLVNYNGNERPSIILCNHEEIAVAVAHGYAKYAKRGMAAALHSNVGLMHGSMAIFNAWADRAPVLILGGNGPMDATLRRPWIDWIHSTNGQGELVREFTKWHNQPSSIAATPEALMRAWNVAHTRPGGPVYVDLDAGLQEQPLDADSAESLLLDPANYPVPQPPAPAQALVRQAAAQLVAAEFPVLMPGQVGSSQEGWDALVALAEALGAAVLLDSHGAASFPTGHVLCQSTIGTNSVADSREVLQKADVVLALERSEVGSTLRQALSPPGGVTGRNARVQISWPKLINVSLEPMHVSSWAADYHELPPAGIPILASPETTLPLLLEEVRRALADSLSARQRAEQRLEHHRERRVKQDAQRNALRERTWDQSPVSMTRAAIELRTALGSRYQDAVLASIPVAWPSGAWEFSRPGAYLGSDGGAGIGSGPGITVGACLAAQQDGRPVIGVSGDGSTLMAPTALWTAAHHRVPALFVVANNLSYFNDEEHQDRVARARQRPPENRWIGQRMEEPTVNFAGLARDLGVEGFGPISDPAELGRAFAGAVAAINEGRPALVDVRITPR